MKTTLASYTAILFAIASIQAATGDGHVVGLLRGGSAVVDEEAKGGHVLGVRDFAEALVDLGGEESCAPQNGGCKFADCCGQLQCCWRGGPHPQAFVCQTDCGSLPTKPPSTAHDDAGDSVDADGSLAVGAHRFDEPFFNLGDEESCSAQNGGCFNSGCCGGLSCCILGNGQHPRFFRCQNDCGSHPVKPDPPSE